jgi:hypothetical protein
MTMVKLVRAPPPKMAAPNPATPARKAAPAPVSPQQTAALFAAAAAAAPDEPSPVKGRGVAALRAQQQANASAAGAASANLTPAAQKLAAKAVKAYADAEAEDGTAGFDAPLSRDVPRPDFEALLAKVSRRVPRSVTVAATVSLACEP